MEIFVLLASIAAFGLTWRAVVKWLGREGRGAIVRHILGLSAGIVVMLLVVLVFALIHEKEPTSEPLSSQEQPISQEPASPEATKSAEPTPNPELAKQIIQAPDNTEEYLRWKRDIIELRQRLRDAPSTENLGEWGDFARSFRPEFDVYSSRLERIEPWAARAIMSPPLGGIRNMFQATAFDNKKDFDEASAYYEKGMKELQRLIDGDSPNQIIIDSERDIIVYKNERKE